MKFTQESKSQLAKLMATENIIVEHQKIPTAAFNLKDRVLYCPIWTDMSGDLYDLLLGHEVGHALETPEEGWHNAVLGSGKFNKNFKHFLNVVEDARIEKKIKRRYPGLRNSFVKAYGQLVERDFFGLKKRDINTMPFIDRLNMYTKAGVQLGIKFTDEEQKMVDQVEGCESWDDVVRVTETVYGYSKTEQHEKQEQKFRPRNLGMMDDTDELDFDDFDMDDDGESETTTPSKSQDGEPDKKGKSKDESEDGDNDAETEETGEPAKGDNKGDDLTDTKTFERDKPSQSVWNDDFDMDEPVCETDEAFRQNESKLLDSRCKEYVYVNLPKPILENVVTSPKRVHDLMEQSWNAYNNGTFETSRDKLYNDFKQKNDRYVGLLAKEFEMRKAASKFAKAKVSESGDIDVSRIYKYQVDDNIFRKISKVPKGKSHGLVMMFDRSGSMQYNMTSTIEQMMVTAMFCRKVNIPFVVYGFGNNEGGFSMDHNRVAGSSFTSGNSEMALSCVFLREYINSRMSNKEFQRCMKNLAVLANSYLPRNLRKHSVPASEGLSNTPMIEAMIALQPLTKQFREQNKLDIVNMVLLHDGDADTTNYVYRGTTTQWFDFNRQNVVVQDKKEKFQTVAKHMDYDSPMRKAVFEWYTHTTGAKIIGFFISAPGSGIRQSVERRYVDETGVGLWEQRYNNSKYYEIRAKTDSLLKEMKEKRFLESNNPGYKKFFLIPGGDELSVENESLQIDGEFTATKLRNAFIKMNKKKQVSRVLVNRFIGEIAV